MSLSKTDLIDKLQSQLGFSKKESSHIIDLVFNIMKDTLSKGEKIKISGFGNFTIRDKAERMGRNPQTGERMKIPSKRVLTFKPSDLLKEDITSKYKNRIREDGSEDTTMSPEEIISKSIKFFQEQQEGNQ